MWLDSWGNDGSRDRFIYPSPWYNGRRDLRRARWSNALRRRAKGVTDSVLDVFIEDDAKEMVKIIEDEFKSLAIDYLLNETECKNAVEARSEKLDGSKLKDMYASDDRREFANDLLMPIVEKAISKRKKIYLPSDSNWQKGLREVLESIADNSENPATA